MLNVRDNWDETCETLFVSSWPRRIPVVLHIGVDIKATTMMVMKKTAVPSAGFSPILICVKEYIYKAMESVLQSRL